MGCGWEVLRGTWLVVCSGVDFLVLLGFTHPQPNFVISIRLRNKNDTISCYLGSMLVYKYNYIYKWYPPPPKPTVTHFLLIFTVFCAYFGALDFELCFGVSSP